MKKEPPAFQGLSGAHSICSAPLLLWLGVEGQLGIPLTSCFLSFLSSKATPHCCPERSSFCGAGPAESWGHSAGCG